MNATEYIKRRYALPAEDSLATNQERAATCAVEDIPLKPAEGERFDETDAGIVALVELILKDQPRLHRLIRVERFQSPLVARLLAICLASFVLFGVAMSLVLTVSGRWPSLMAVSDWLERPTKDLGHFAVIEPGAGQVQPWINGDVWKLIGAYAVGLVAATGVCLPSLYFYCLLSGVRLTMVDVVLHAVKAKAEAAMALMGILPIYVAVAMGVIIFGNDANLLASVLLLGLILPFIAGLRGTASLYYGFAQVCRATPTEYSERRECFLRRLVLAWSACYSAIMPVMIYTLWEAASRF